MKNIEITDGSDSPPVLDDLKKQNASILTLDGIRSLIQSSSSPESIVAAMWDFINTKKPNNSSSYQLRVSILRDKNVRSMMRRHANVDVGNIDQVVGVTRNIPLALLLSDDVCTSYLDHLPPLVSVVDIVRSRPFGIDPIETTTRRVPFFSSGEPTDEPTKAAREDDTNQGAAMTMSATALLAQADAAAEEGAVVQDFLKTSYGDIQPRKSWEYSPRSNTEPTRSIEMIKSYLEMVAEKGHAAHPQFKGYWKDWRLGKMARRAEFKGGSAAEKGDYVLISPRANLEMFEVHFGVSIYNVRCNGNCGVALSEVIIL